MRLKTIVIKDFLSVRGKIVLSVDPQVTILLGANDHGKSNILSALAHLNDGAQIQEDEVNWDAAEIGDEPLLEYTFSLTDAELATFNTLLDRTALTLEEKIASFNERRKPGEKDLEDEVADPEDDEDEDEDDEDVDDEATDAAEEDDAERLKQSQDFLAAVQRLVAGIRPHLPYLTFVRAGVKQNMSVGGVDLTDVPDEVVDWLDRRPRVELFKALSGEIQDSVTQQEIVMDSFEFLQGIFYAAGLDPMNCASLFKQTDASERKLDGASAVLDTQLRDLWAQGTDLGLHFELRHRDGAIQFLANDPSVQARKTRMSKRSTGVTQFFRISMVLHARRRKNPANAYIYLFDEPGVFLHPQGQKDLMQVFEGLSSEAQVFYTTHSLFMLNQNFPERHRLVIRGNEGTRVDQKPYRNNWRLATDALGVYLTSNILFSSRILLVEGDSDPIYIYELLRWFNRNASLDADSNSLGIVSFSDLPNLRFLLQVFKRDNADAKLLVLVDGDSQGASTIAHIKKLCNRLKVSMAELAKDTSIEDYVLFEDLFIDAVIETIRIAADSEQITLPSEYPETVKAKWKEHIQGAASKKTTGRWFNELSESLLSDHASKVALARTYAFSCRENPSKPDAEHSKRALKICKDIAEQLGMPKLRALKVIVDTTAKA